MINKTIYFILLIIMILCLTSCSKNDVQSMAEQGEIETFDWNSCISADKYTGILYYNGVDGMICPYYSENGKLCRYVDGHIEEIE